MIGADAGSLKDHQRFEEAKSLLRRTIPVARRVLGEGADLTLRMRWIYAEALYKGDGATLDDLREAVMTLEDIERTGRRVFGGAHPLTTGIEGYLRNARAALRASETPGDRGRVRHNTTYSERRPPLFTKRRSRAR